MEQRVVMQTPEKSDYFYNEAIKTLRTNIQFSNKDVKVVLITSCFPNEGKSDISFHVSQEMAHSGKKVLLIDADIRNSVYVQKYDVDQKTKGLSQFLSGQIALSELVYQTNFPNMDMIFAGPIAPNPSELLGTKEFDELLKVMRARYDYIFVDTTPIADMIDPAVIAQRCDGAILVIERNAVSYKVEQRAKEQIERSGCPLLGAVLNKVEMRKNRYYSGYYGYYSGYYGRYGRYGYGYYGKDRERK